MSRICRIDLALIAHCLLAKATLALRWPWRVWRVCRLHLFSPLLYEEEDDLGDTAYDNAAKLLKLGTQVKTGVDASCLSKTIGQRRFRTIIFQFPNVASREVLYAQNPNHVLVTRFLKSSRAHLKSGGLVVISTVDSPFYEGAFKMDDAAKKTGFATPDIYTFNPKDYPAYSHQNTADEESAINEHTAFATFVLSA